MDRAYWRREHSGKSLYLVDVDVHLGAGLGRQSPKMLGLVHLSRRRRTEGLWLWRIWLPDNRVYIPDSAEGQRRVAARINNEGYAPSEELAKSIVAGVLYLAAGIVPDEGRMVWRAIP